jgi:hypothetical protein
MPEQRSDPVWLDDVEESPLESPLPRRLCIVSGDALLCREFIAALQTVVGPNQRIEIIQDRRRRGPGAAPGQPSVDRRRLSHVDALVKMDGYAIVPLPKNPRIPNPGPIEHRSNAPRPAEHSPFNRRLPDDGTDADERELERILQFKRRREVRLGPPLIVGAVIVAAVVSVLALLVVQLPAMKTLMSRTRPTAPPAERTSEPVQAEQAPSPATPSPPERSSTLPPPGDGESGERLPAANSTLRAQTDTIPRAQTSTAPRPQTGTVSAVPPVPPSRGSSRLSAGVRAPETLRSEASRFPGVPRVELTRNSLLTPEGKADSYVVRMSDPAGRPLAGAEVLLFADMADGTVESIMLGAGPEPGTYSGTARPRRSAPIAALRVRMTMSDRRIETPMRP